MPTPPTLSFTAENGETLDLNGDDYVFLQFGSAWNAPPTEVDVISRTQAGGVSIPYAAVGERVFRMLLLVNADNAAQAQERLNRLYAATYITLGSNEPRFGVLTFDGYGASSTPLAISCAVKEHQTRAIGHSREVLLTFTSESGIWYSPMRITVASATVGIGSNVPLVGSNVGYPGDPMPWEFGSGQPHAEVEIDYVGTAISRSLEARVAGPAVNPLFRRGDVVLAFDNLEVPANTTLLARMASGARHQLLGAGDEVLDGNVVARGDSFQIPLAPGRNVVYYAQDNEVDGVYNQVVFSYRNEYLSVGV